MIRNKKGPPPVCETESGNKQICFEGFEQLENTMIRNELQELFPHSRDLAITGGALAAVCGCSLREITKKVYALRRLGVPIMADPAAGYWLTDSRKELHWGADALRRRANEILQTADALEGGTDDG